MERGIKTNSLKKQGTKLPFQTKPSYPFLNQQNKKPLPNNSNANYNVQQTVFNHKNHFAIHHSKSSVYSKTKIVGSKAANRDEYPEMYYPQKPFAKNTDYNGYSPDRGVRNLSSCSTVPSEEEATQSSLYGFKVVHDSRTLHDEITPELEDRTNKRTKSGMPIRKDKFAASVYNIGPNLKDVPLPSFVDDDSEEEIEREFFSEEEEL